eukprot:COSAG03_NODE_24434_length_272_cov_0.797688_1_plen_49_part_01
MGRASAAGLRSVWPRRYREPEDIQARSLSPSNRRLSRLRRERERERERE